MTFEFALRLFTAFACGVAIGLERQIRQRTAGLRTITLVASGACLFVTLGVLTGNGIPGVTQIAAYVVSGVGFLGGGVIMRDKGSIQGINTAATLWCSAAVGVLGRRPLPARARGHGRRAAHQHAAARREPGDQRDARVERRSRARISNHGDLPRIGRSAHPHAAVELDVREAAVVPEPDERGRAARSRCARAHQGDGDAEAARRISRSSSRSRAG